MNPVLNGRYPYPVKRARRSEDIHIWSRVFLPLECVGGVCSPSGFVARTRFNLVMVVDMLTIVEGYRCAGRKASLKSPPMIIRCPCSLASVTFLSSVSYM